MYILLLSSHCYFLYRVTENMNLNAIANSAATGNFSAVPENSSRGVASPGANTNAGNRMDVNDFIRAAEIDPVLVKILLVKPKKRINQMLKRIALEQAVSLFIISV